MAIYTLTTDAAQEAVLSWIVKTYNQAHDLKLTNADYVSLRLPQLLAPFAGSYKDAVAESITTQFSISPPEVQAQVLSLLKATP